jgi:Zn-finger nucleic acid-binding protein
MKCPVCETSTFAHKDLQQSLHALTCTNCGGNWINSFQYWLWKDKHPENLPEKESSITLQTSDVIKSKVCPECSKLLSRYHVGHGVSFTIDRCEQCRGIWFDANEWEILHDKNLHDEIHFIFSNHWQKTAREEIMGINRDNNLSRLIGDENIAKVKEFKAWLKSQKERSTIIAYLSD